MRLTVSVAPVGSEPISLGGAGYADLRTDEGERECFDPASGVRVVLRGDIYLPATSDPARTILEGYLDKGVEYVGSMEGSYLAVVVDPARGAMAITDPLATRKGFYSAHGGSADLSTRLGDLADPWPGVSAAGVASHLSSNGTHGGLTPLDGVEMVPPGSIARLSPGNIDIEPYHDWRFEPEDVRPQDVLRDEMVDLMRSAVADRLVGTSASSAFLSLSGGYDSRGLLGFLVEDLGPSGVEAFTYHHGESVGDMDRDAAIRLAGIAGVRHRVIEGYRGDFMAVLDHNARRGLGIAHFCDEADVWRGLERECAPGGQVLVAGDRQSHHFWLGRALTPAESLSVVSVRPSAGVEWFLDGLAPDVGSALRLGWDERFASLAHRLEEAGSWQAALMEAYLIERVAYTLNLWRELYGGASMTVVNPFLDVRLLEFVARLPLAMNDVDRGLLHMQAIAAAFPRFNGVPTTSGGWNRPHWGVEMARHADRIREVLEEPSPLDDLIAPEHVVTLLARVEAERPDLAHATSGLGWRLRKVVKRSPLLRERVRRHRLQQRAAVPAVPAHEVLRRLLYLRRALSVLRWG